MVDVLFAAASASRRCACCRLAVWRFAILAQPFASEKRRCGPVVVLFQQESRAGWGRDSPCIALLSRRFASAVRVRSARKALPRKTALGCMRRAGGQASPRVCKRRRGFLDAKRKRFGRCCRIAGKVPCCGACRQLYCGAKPQCELPEMRGRVSYGRYIG